MKKILLLVVFVIVTFTSNIWAFDESDRKLGVCLSQIHENDQILDDCWLKPVNQNEFLENSFPERYIKISQKIKDGDFIEARQMADELANTLQYGYEGEACFDGERMFAISDLIKKEVKEVFKSKDSERKKLFILKNKFDDIGIKNYKKLSRDKEFIYSVEVQNKLKEKIKNLFHDDKQFFKFVKKLSDHDLIKTESIRDFINESELNNETKIKLNRSISKVERSWMFH